MIPSSAMVTNLIYIVADVLSTLALIYIARSGWSTKSRLHESKRKEMAWPAWGIAAAYVLTIYPVGRGCESGFGEGTSLQELREQYWLTLALLWTR